MKSSKIIVLIILAAGWLLPIIPAQAQTYNIGVYLSYRGEASDTELWQSGDIWTVRGIPQGWRSLFDADITPYPQIGKMLDIIGGDDKLTQIIDDNAIERHLTPAMVKPVVELYKRNGNERPITVRFVLLGQGVTGGFLARYIAGAASNVGLRSIKDPDTGLTIANATFAVIASGAPFQGSPLTEASLGPVSQYRDVETLLSDYEETLKTALQTPDFGILSPWVDVINFLKFVVPKASGAVAGALIASSTADPAAAAAGSSVASQLTKELYTEFFNLLTPKKRHPRDAGYQSLISMLRVDFNVARSTQAAETNFGQTNTYLRTLLRPRRGSRGGSMIEKVNSMADPEHYRAIIGAEKSATPYRIVTEIRNADLEEMNEPVLINLHQGFIHATRLQADGWRHKAGRFYYFWNKPKFRERSRRWRAGQYALQNVDATWGTIIGAFKMEKVKRTMKVYDASKCKGRAKSGARFSLKPEDINFKMPTGGYGNCEPWRYETHTVNVRVPLKSDGFLPPGYAVWDEGDNPNDKQHNWYYGDTGDGGYNNLELLRYKRTYTEGDNRKGERAEPMDETRKWLMQEVL